jgi:hypothetical protein
MWSVIASANRIGKIFYSITIIIVQRTPENAPGGGVKFSANMTISLFFSGGVGVIQYFHGNLLVVFLRQPGNGVTEQASVPAI